MSKIADKLSPDMQEKIQKNVEKVLQKMLSKNDSVEDMIKALLVEKVMNILGVVINRPVLKKLAKVSVKRSVDKVWEEKREEFMTRFK